MSGFVIDDLGGFCLGFRGRAVSAGSCFPQQGVSISLSVAVLQELRVQVKYNVVRGLTALPCSFLTALHNYDLKSVAGPL